MNTRLLDPARSQLLIVDMQEKLLPAMADAEEALKNTDILVKAAKAMLVPVVVSEQYPSGLGATVEPLRGQMPVDDILEKVEFSCFANSLLSARLLNGDRTLIIAGVEAHVCVLQTAIAGVEHGREVAVVVDATASRRPSSHAAALQRLQAAGVQLVTTEMVVFEWLGSKASPAFKDLGRLLR